MKLSHLALAPLLLIVGCASMTTNFMVHGPEAFDAELERLDLDRSQVVNPFEFTSEMQTWAEDVTRNIVDPRERLKTLQNAIFYRHDFSFEYASKVTLTGAEAFETRRGNCLAFTSMFVALSRSIGMKTFILTVQRRNDVDKEETLVIVNRHVVAGYWEAGSLYIYDFYMSSEMPVIRYREVDDVVVASMFHSNLGAQLLQTDEIEAAIEELKIATALMPSLASGWINYGVALRRNEDIEGARAAYQRALEEEPGNSSAMTNLAYLYHMEGRAEEARAALVAAAGNNGSPFALIALADIEMSRDNLKVSRDLLLRARRRHPSLPEIYEALGRWADLSDKSSQARRYRERARELQVREDRLAGRPSSAVAAKGPLLPIGQLRSF